MSARYGLARVLSKRGLCSRSEAARLVAAGRVRVGGRVVRDPEAPTLLDADVAIDGDEAAAAEPLHLLLNKPRGLVTTRSDEQGRATDRIIWPVAVGYFDSVRHLIAWCELRRDFRSFRTDRIGAATFLDERYPERPSVLRARWRKTLKEN